MAPLNDASDHQEMRRMMAQNAELLQENNQLLRKIHRNAVWAFWLRVVWYLVIIGLPFALFYYVIEPYVTSQSASYETLLSDFQDVLRSYNVDTIINGANTQPPPLNSEGNQVE